MATKQVIKAVETREDFNNQFKSGLNVISRFVKDGKVVDKDKIAQWMKTLKFIRTVGEERLLREMDDMYKVIAELADPPKEEVVEEPKKKSRKRTVVAHGEETKEEDPLEELKELTEEEEKPAPKTSGKKEEPKKETVSFPATLVTKEFGKLKRCSGKYQTIDELHVDFEEGVELFVLCYWTKSDIKKYGYSKKWQVPPVKEFPDDFDVLRPFYFSQMQEKMHCMSAYTEAYFDFMPDELEETEGVRYQAGLEYQIYVAVKGGK
jgi:hypothetical protein